MRTFLPVVCILFLLPTARAQTAAQDTAEESPPTPQRAEAGSPTASDKSADLLKIGISPFKPFAMTNRDVPAGFSIDLWSDIARQLNRRYELISYPGVQEKLQALRDGEVDVAIGGITITAEREKEMDFSHPTFRTGLDIMVPTASTGFSWSSIAKIITPGKLAIIIGFILLIIISGHLIWYAERGKEAFNDKYIPGVFEGMYWAIVTASTVGYGDKAPAKWSGRIVAGLVIIISLPMFALFTAELASSFTVQSMESAIQNPSDLAGKKVGVLRGTTSAKQVEDFQANTVGFERIEEAYASLKKSSLDAVVYDAPNMRYYIGRKGQGKLMLLGKLFMEQSYGMAVPEGDPLREQINLAMLKLTESGEFQRLKESWFGKD